MSVSTRWAASDAVMSQHGNTDHWTKMKIKATQFVPSFNEHGDLTYQPVDPNAADQFGDSKTPKAVTKPRKDTEVNQRAKGDFKYWHQERPNPTSFGKYGIGSYKTVLGLGNAPRT